MRCLFSIRDVEEMSCPVNHGKSANGGDNSTASAPPFGLNVSSYPVVSEPDLNPANNMPKVAEQSVWPGQTEALPTQRAKSSIPKGSFTPPHQQGVEEEDTWVYPSEQQFYNAMKRKGWNPKEHDMAFVVAIHNAVNEKTWKEVMKWEKKFHCDCEEPKLLKFQGRPNDMSPKARLLSLMGYNPPFDRHDWTVDRCGKQVRYVVDFYRGKQIEGSPASFHIDARPALDSLEAVKERMMMAFSEWFGSSSSSSTTATTETPSSSSS